MRDIAAKRDALRDSLASKFLNPDAGFLLGRGRHWSCSRPYAARGRNHLAQWTTSLSSIEKMPASFTSIFLTVHIRPSLNATLRS